MRLLRMFTVALCSDVIVCLGGSDVGVPKNEESLAGGGGGMDILDQKNNVSVEIVDGIFMSFPDSKYGNETIVKFRMNVPEFRTSLEELQRERRAKGGRAGGGGGGGGGHKDKKLLQRILPLFIVPFLIQSAIIPMFLSVLKMMLMKSLMVGKLALLLVAVNAFRTSNSFKSRSEEKIADAHYGYHGAGMEEYGAYVNKRQF